MTAYYGDNYGGSNHNRNNRSSVPRKLIAHTDLPLLSQEDQIKRRKLRQQILLGPNVELPDDEDDDLVGGGGLCVQIMGLELLQTPSQFCVGGAAVDDEEDDYSYDSYAHDSVSSFRREALQLPTGRLTAAKAISSTSAAAPGHLHQHLQQHQQQQQPVRSFQRRMSNCSSIGENQESADGNNVDTDAYGYEYERCSSPSKRRSNSNHGSNKKVHTAGGDSVDYGRYKSTRRGSLDSYAGDSVDCGRSSKKSHAVPANEAADSNDYGRYKSTRRGSLDSYAGDSVDYGRYKNSSTDANANTKTASHAQQQRRGSMESYAVDSVDRGYKNTKTARRNSMESYAGDSVDYQYGRYKSTARRGSMESYAGDSVDYGRYKSTAKQQQQQLESYAGDESFEYGKYKGTARRGSMESYAVDSVDRGYKNTKTARRASMGSNGGESFEYGKYKSTARRGSMESYAVDSVEGGRYKNTKTARRGSTGSNGGESFEYGKYKSTARRGSMESYAVDSVGSRGYNSTNANTKTAQQRRGSTGSNAENSFEYGRYKSFARRGSMESYAADSVEGGGGRGYKSATRRASVGSTAGSVEYGRYRCPKRVSMASYAADSVENGRNTIKNITTTKSTKAAPAAVDPGAGFFMKPPEGEGGSKGAGFLIQPPTRRASVTGYAPHLLCDFDRKAIASKRRQSTSTSNAEIVNSKAADLVDYGKYKSTNARRASMGSYAADSIGSRYKGTRSDSIGSQSKHNMSKNSGHGHGHRSGRPQQRLQRRFSNMSDYATDSITDVVVGKNGIKSLLGASCSSHFPRRFSLNTSFCSGDGSVCSFSTRAA
jgi:hypothetical protein